MKRAKRKGSSWCSWKRISVACFIALLLVAGCSDDPLSPITRHEEVPLSPVSPNQIGWSAEDLESAAAFAAEVGATTVVVLYQGRTVFSYGDIDQKYPCQELIEPILGTLYGIYADRNQIDLDATMEQLGIDDIPYPLTAEEKQATVRHLLMMRSGIYHRAAGESEFAVQTRPPRGSHLPGTHFFYNPWDCNALGTILRQQIGQDITLAFKREIADPIGMQDFSMDDGIEFHDGTRSIHPVLQWQMSTRDLARFCLLLQRGGTWRGESIVPSAWVDASTSSYSVLDPELGIGYGYLWLTMTETAEFGRGFYYLGQDVDFIGIWPQEDLVYVYRVDSDLPYDETADASYELFQIIQGARSPDPLETNDGSFPQKP